MTTTPSVSDASRLFCVGRNYAAHAREMGAERPPTPVFFMKPGSSRVLPGKAVLPSGHGRVDFEGELVLLLSGDPETPVAGIGLGVDLTLREQQAELKRQSLPWEVAKAFDGSALVAPFAPFRGRLNEGVAAMQLETRVNGELRQQASAADMLFRPSELIAHLGRYWQLRPGDLLFTGTPEGVGPVCPGDVIEMRAVTPEGVLGPFQWQLEAS
jgi:fumarylpyruvate hydrolase